MKNKALNILFATALSFGCFAAIAKFAVSKVEEPIVEKVEAAEGNYYSGISDSLTGDSLLNALHTLNSQKRKSTVGYAGFRQFAAKCDIDPDGSGKIIGFYDNKKVGPSWDSGSTWNREHVWPNVRDGDKVESDAHMIRPAATSTNSGRGSKGFGTDSYDPGEYVPYYRGAAARIIFYAAIADTSLKVVDYSFPYDGVGSGNHGYDVGTMGSLSDMLRWNLQYSPKDTSFTGSNDLARRTELNRNEVIQNASGGQGNRNPFIDHPEYACKIWGDTNATTKQICGGGGGETATVTSVTVNPSTAKLDLAGTKTQTLTATVNGTNSPAQTVTWSSSDSNIVSVSNGTITAKAVGTATITATSTVDTTKKGICSVTVVDGTVPPEPPAPLTLDKTEMHIAVKEQTFLIATVGNEDKITWTIDKAGEKVLHLYKKESVSGEKFYIYSLANGVATLTATSSNGESVSCVVTIGTGKAKKANINTPLVVGLSAGGGTILIAGLIVLIVLLVKKKHV